MEYRKKYGFKIQGEISCWRNGMGGFGLRRGHISLRGSNHTDQEKTGQQGIQLFHDSSFWFWCLMAGLKISIGIHFSSAVLPLRARKIPTPKVPGCSFRTFFISETPTQSQSEVHAYDDLIIRARIEYFECGPHIGIVQIGNEIGAF